MIPSTSYQLLVIFALILPGIVFSSTLQRLRGPTPEDKDASTRILRAIAVGAGFDVIYALIFGPALARLVQATPDKPGGIRSAFLAEPRVVALWVLLLAGLIPAAAAGFVYGRAVFFEAKGLPLGERISRVCNGSYHPIPTAWDYISQTKGGCFVRVRLGDGEFIGGWVDERSYVSGYPEPRDMFISSPWALDKRGVFLHKIEDSLGVYVPLPDDVVVEWVAAPPDPSGGEAGGQVDTDSQ